MLFAKKEKPEIFKDSSVVADSYSEIASRLINKLQDTKNRVIAFTSSVSGEGCTETVLGVASALTSAGKKVLVIDANHKDPTLHTRLETENKEGFSDLLTNGGAIKNYVSKHSLGFDLMTFGTKPQEYLETFDAENFEKVITSIKEKYRYVVIDTPPVAKISEPSAALYKLSSTLLVARMNLVTTKDIKKSLAFAKEFGFEFVSVVLNGAEK